LRGPTSVAILLNHRLYLQSTGSATGTHHWTTTLFAAVLVVGLCFVYYLRGCSTSIRSCISPFTSLSLTPACDQRRLKLEICGISASLIIIGLSGSPDKFCFSLTRVTRSPAFGADSACGSMILPILCVRFFRAPRGKTEHQKNNKYRSAARPELVEGKAKLPTA